MAFETLITMTELDTSWRLWRLERPLVYRTELPLGGTITVPASFVSDGPTIPRILWSLWPVWGSYGRAGIVHDYLCFRIDKNMALPVAPTRWKADDVFLDAMASLGVNLFTRYILFLGARLGTILGVKTRMVQYNAIRAQERKLGKAIL